MRPALPVLLGLSIAACERDVSFNTISTSIALWPDLVDLGNGPAGIPREAGVRIEHQAGATVEVVSLGFEGDQAARFTVTEPPVVLDPGDEVPLTITFTPPEDGYSLATLVLETSSAELPRIEASVRGRAAAPGLGAWPALIDFGPVAVGATGTATLTVSNDGGLDLSLDAASVDAPFAVDAVFPAAIDAGTEVQLPLTVTPTDLEPATVQLTLSTSAGPLVVPLRVNDCVNGTPSLYDADADGFTACAGDCDDGDPLASPAGIETCSGADEDCDGTPDNGTSCFDDDLDGQTEDEGDCNDADPDVSGLQTEIPGNGIDDDCDGEVDIGGEDADGDGYGPGIGGDCDDGDPTAYPGAPEIIDGDDENCDGVPDDGTAAFDDDQDGLSEQQGDCDDDDDTVFPGAPELPDGKDNDCDAKVDEGTVRYDDDGDGYTELGGDCNDADPAITPPC